MNAKPTTAQINLIARQVYFEKPWLVLKDTGDSMTLKEAVESILGYQIARSQYEATAWHFINSGNERPSPSQMANQIKENHES